MTWKRARLVWQKVARIVTPLWAAGFAFLALALLTEPHDQFEFRRFITSSFSHVAIALIVGALLVTVDKVIFFMDLKEEIVRLLRLRSLVVDSGLVDVAARDDRHFQGFGKLVDESDRLVVVVNYGKDWVANWREHLVRRFQRQGTVTEWFLLDPISDFLKLLAAKQHVAIAELEKKITDTEQDLLRCYDGGHGQGTLRIYRMPCPVFPTVSVYLGETAGEKGMVLFTLYTTSSHKGAVPLLQFEDQSPRPNTFTFFQEDINRLVATITPSQERPLPLPSPPAVAVPPPPTHP